MKIIKSTKNIKGKYPIKNSTGGNRAVLKYKNKSFTIYDNSDSINLPANADLEALRKWKAQISQQAGAYNDADEDYEWASLSNGVVSYYRRGKLVDKSYYMSPSDWGVETLEEWFQLVVNDVIENLYEANSDKNDVTSSTILDVNPEFRNNFEEAIDFFYESYPATVELTDEVDEDYDTLYKAYVKEIGSLYQQAPGIVYIDINWDSGEILQALEETAESIGIEQYSYDDIEMSTFSDKNNVTSSTIKTSYEVELDPEESMIDVNIDQYIIVDSEGSWNYDSDNYDWASSDGQGSDWYSDNGVRLDDPTGVVEKIDELIEPHVPIEPGTYRVEGYIELYYTVSGVYENRYDYTEDDYSSDINSDFGSAEYNKKLSKIENVKVTKI